MKYWNLCSAALTTLITCCGGGGAYNPPADTPTTPPATTYNVVAPSVNSQRIYARNIVDTLNSVINQSISRTVSSVNADGSFAIQQEDPNHNAISVNGWNYSIPTETINFNPSVQETSYSYTPAGGSLITCTIAPHGAGPSYPVVIGDSWSSSYTQTCGNNTPITYTQTGSVVDAESLVVPAGTYNTLKLQSTISWTESNGTTYTETVTNWRDINTGLPVQEKTTTAYTGTPLATGHPVSRTDVLQSQK